MLVHWFIMEEEECIGVATLKPNTETTESSTQQSNSPQQVFVVEVAQRFDAPDLYVYDNLRDAVLRQCFLDEEDLEDADEKEYFDTCYKEAEEALKKYEQRNS